MGRLAVAGELEGLLEEWSARREIEVAERDAEGRHYLVFDGSFEVAMSQAGNTIYLEADVAEIPARAEAAEELLERLMKLQLVHARKGDETLSVAGAGGTLTLFRVLPADRLDLRRFEGALGDFVNALAFMVQSAAGGVRRAAPVLPQAEQIFIP